MSYPTFLVLLVLAAVLIILAKKFFRRDRFLKDEIKEEKPSTAKACYYLTDGRRSEAMEEFKQVILKGDAVPEAYIMLSALNRLQGNLDKAVYFCEEALLWHENGDEIISTALNELAKNYLIAGKAYNAQNCLLKLSKKFHNLPAVNLINAEICKEKEDFETAGRCYSKYETLSGKEYGSIVNEMYIRHLKNTKDNAHRIKTFRSLIKKYPECGNVRFALATALFEDGKNEQGLSEIKAIIANDLIKTKEEMLELENIFYRYSTIDELFHIMSSKIALESENPIPYLFVSSYYGKKNDTTSAQEVLKAYILQFQPKAIIVKAYVKLANDPILSRLLRVNNIYRCGLCNVELGDYTAVCPSCGNVDSLNYQ
ncbi:MAG: hypothetical protein LBH05_07270 [Deferribacteraceae bacterium]|jgi:lipopolysaccharide biosynthesis regulator YciM|nr:hypothetical protein [Deferribacteraceae bacterium]